MPRTAKRPPGAGNQGGYQGHGNPGGGAGGQAPAAPTGMPYGEHQASIQAQQQMPVAAGNAPPPPPAGGGGGDPMMAALQGALGMQPPGGPGLLGPSQRPTEPVTHGLPSGPGGGPEVLAGSTGSGLADVLSRIAEATGDPRTYDIAERARLLSGGR